MGLPIKRKKKDTYPPAQQPQQEQYIPQGPDLPHAHSPPPQQQNTYLSRMIEEKKAELNNEKMQMEQLQRKMEDDVKEVEALQFINSGDPTIAIADLLDIIDEYRRDDGEKIARDVLGDMERSLIKSTMNGM